MRNLTKTFGLLALAASLVAMPARAQDRVVRPAAEAAAHILSDGGPLHHHALHQLNPLIERFKAFYPSRAHIIIDDQEFTVLNVGRSFQVAEGLYGKSWITIETEAEMVEEIYSKVSGGMPGEGLPRIEIASLMREITAVSFDLPEGKDEAGPGPKPSKLEAPLFKLAKLTRTFLDQMAKASKAKADGKKLGMLYWGLLSKITGKRQEKLQKKMVGALLKELGRDLDEGRVELTPGGVWSSFVNAFSFLMLRRDTGGSGFIPVLQPLRERLKGLLQYHKTLEGEHGIPTRDEILQKRLELIEASQTLLDL